MQLAVSLLAVPYLLNPAGIVVLVDLSANAASLASFALMFAILVVVIELDFVVFRWANRVQSARCETLSLLPHRPTRVAISAPVVANSGYLEVLAAPDFSVLFPKPRQEASNLVVIEPKRPR